MTKLQNKAEVPASLLQLLSAADKQRGLPEGTMASVMQQEVGGRLEEFITDPSTYHYGLNADGRRVAGHTGKVSTAFGPFGILESTAADPGYGVKPLQDKSLEEQVRFAADYLAARSKGAGSLAGGLAGYGEGAKYAQQVAGRIGGKGGAPVPAPVTQVAAVPQGAVEATPNPPDVAPVVVEAAQAPQGPDPWQQFLQMAQRQAASSAPVHVADLSAYGQQPMRVPEFNLPQIKNQPVDFRAFGQWGAKLA